MPCRAMDSTGIEVKVKGEGEWHARKHGGAKRRVWRKIHLGIDEQTLEIRAILCPSGDLKRKSAERGSPGTASVKRPCCPSCSARSAPEKRQTVEALDGRCDRPERGPSRIEIPRPCALATMERIPPPERRRDEDASCQTAGPAAHGAGLRPTGRRAPDPHRRPERRHRARQARHRGRATSLSGDRGTSAISRIVQQGPCSRVVSKGTASSSLCRPICPGSIMKPRRRPSSKLSIRP